MLGFNLVVQVARRDGLAALSQAAEVDGPPAQGQQHQQVEAQPKSGEQLIVLSLGKQDQVEEEVEQKGHNDSPGQGDAENKVPEDQNRPTEDPAYQGAG